MAHCCPVPHQPSVEHVIEMRDERNLGRIDMLNFAAVDDLPDARGSNHGDGLNRIFNTPDETFAGSQHEGAATLQRRCESLEMTLLHKSSVQCLTRGERRSHADIRRANANERRDGDGCDKGRGRRASHSRRRTFSTRAGGVSKHSSRLARSTVTWMVCALVRTSPLSASVMT